MQTLIQFNCIQILAPIAHFLNTFFGFVWVINEYEKVKLTCGKENQRNRNLEKTKLHHSFDVVSKVIKKNLSGQDVISVVSNITERK